MISFVPPIFLRKAVIIGLLCNPGVAVVNTVLAQEPIPKNTAPQATLFTELQRYARLADAAYESPSHIETVTKEYGYQLDHRANLPVHEVTYYLATNDAERRHVVAVRGTANVNNALVDIDIQLVDDEQTGIRLHRGFAAAAKGIYEKIKPKLNKDYEIRTTGHSLGGAVALILAMYLDSDGYRVDKVVTFGQPKVTNILGAKKFSDLDVWRVVTARDLVPVVPPLDPVDIKNLDIYWHLGQEIILLDETQYSMTSGVESMLRAAGFLSRQLTQKNMQHHRMVSYLALIDQKQGKAQWVPYKNDFNIFSIFGSDTDNADKARQ
jgi:hypothetical protein